MSTWDSGASVRRPHPWGASSQPAATVARAAFAPIDDAPDSGALTHDADADADADAVAEADGDVNTNASTTADGGCPGEAMQSDDSASASALASTSNTSLSVSSSSTALSTPPTFRASTSSAAAIRRARARRSAALSRITTAYAGFVSARAPHAFVRGRAAAMTLHGTARPTTLRLAAPLLPWGSALDAPLSAAGAPLDGAGRAADGRAADASMRLSLLRDPQALAIILSNAAAANTAPALTHAAHSDGGADAPALTMDAGNNTFVASESANTGAAVAAADAAAVAPIGSAAGVSFGVPASTHSCQLSIAHQPRIATVPATVSGIDLVTSTELEPWTVVGALPRARAQASRSSGVANSTAKRTGKRRSGPTTASKPAIPAPDAANMSTNPTQDEVEDADVQLPTPNMTPEALVAAATAAATAAAAYSAPWHRGLRARRTTATAGDTESAGADETDHADDEVAPLWSLLPRRSPAFRRALSSLQQPATAPALPAATLSRPCSDPEGFPRARAMAVYLNEAYAGAVAFAYGARDGRLRYLSNATAVEDIARNLLPRGYDYTAFRFDYPTGSSVNTRDAALTGCSNNVERTPLATAAPVTTRNATTTATEPLCDADAPVTVATANNGGDDLGLLFNQSTHAHTLGRALGGATADAFSHITPWALAAARRALLQPVSAMTAAAACAAALSGTPVGCAPGSAQAAADGDARIEVDTAATRSFANPFTPAALELHLRQATARTGVDARLIAAAVADAAACAFIAADESDARVASAVVGASSDSSALDTAVFALNGSADDNGETAKFIPLPQLLTPATGSGASEHTSNAEIGAKNLSASLKTALLTPDPRCPPVLLPTYTGMRPSDLELYVYFEAYDRARTRIFTLLRPFVLSAMMADDRAPTHALPLGSAARAATRLLDLNRRDVAAIALAQRLQLPRSGDTQTSLLAPSPALSLWQRAPAEATALLQTTGALAPLVHRLRRAQHVEAVWRAAALLPLVAAGAVDSSTTALDSFNTRTAARRDAPTDNNSDYDSQDDDKNSESGADDIGGDFAAYNDDEAAAATAAAAARAAELAARKPWAGEAAVCARAARDAAMWVLEQLRLVRLRRMRLERAVEAAAHALQREHSRSVTVGAAAASGALHRASLLTARSAVAKLMRPARRSEESDELESARARLAGEAHSSDSDADDADASDNSNDTSARAGARSRSKETGKVAIAIAKIASGTLLPLLLLPDLSTEDQTQTAFSHSSSAFVEVPSSVTPRNVENAAAALLSRSVTRSVAPLARTTATAVVPPLARALLADLAATRPISMAAARYAEGVPAAPMADNALPNSARAQSALLGAMASAASAMARAAGAMGLGESDSEAEIAAADNAVILGGDSEEEDDDDDDMYDAVGTQDRFRKSRRDMLKRFTLSLPSTKRRGRGAAGGRYAMKPNSVGLWSQPRATALLFPPPPRLDVQLASASHGNSMFVSVSYIGARSHSTGGCGLYADCTTDRRGVHFTGGIPASVLPDAFTDHMDPTLAPAAFEAAQKSPSSAAAAYNEGSRFKQHDLSGTMTTVSSARTNAPRQLLSATDWTLAAADHALDFTLALPTAFLRPWDFFPNPGAGAGRLAPLTLLRARAEADVTGVLDKMSLVADAVRADAGASGSAVAANSNSFCHASVDEATSSHTARFVRSRVRCPGPKLCAGDCGDISSCALGTSLLGSLIAPIYSLSHANGTATAPAFVSADVTEPSTYAAAVFGASYAQFTLPTERWLWQAEALHAARTVAWAGDAGANGFGEETRGGLGTDSLRDTRLAYLLVTSRLPPGLPAPGPAAEAALAAAQMSAGGLTTAGAAQAALEAASRNAAAARAAAEAATAAVAAGDNAAAVAAAAAAARAAAGADDLTSGADALIPAWTHLISAAAELTKQTVFAAPRSHTADDLLRGPAAAPTAGANIRGCRTKALPSDALCPPQPLAPATSLWLRPIDRGMPRTFGSLDAAAQLQLLKDAPPPPLVMSGVQEINEAHARFAARIDARCSRRFPMPASDEENAPSTAEHDDSSASAITPDPDGCVIDPAVAAALPLAPAYVDASAPPSSLLRANHLLWAHISPWVTASLMSESVNAPIPNKPQAMTDGTSSEALESAVLARFATVPYPSLCTPPLLTTAALDTALTRFADVVSPEAADALVQALATCRGAVTLPSLAERFFEGHRVADLVDQRSVTYAYVDTADSGLRGGLSQSVRRLAHLVQMPLAPDVAHGLSAAGRRALVAGAAAGTVVDGGAADRQRGFGAARRLATDAVTMRRENKDIAKLVAVGTTQALSIGLIKPAGLSAPRLRRMHDDGDAPELGVPSSEQRAMNDNEEMGRDANNSGFESVDSGDDSDVLTGTQAASRLRKRMREEEGTTEAATSSATPVVDAETVARRQARAARNAVRAEARAARQRARVARAAASEARAEARRAARAAENAKKRGRARNDDGNRGLTEDEDEKDIASSSGDSEPENDDEQLNSDDDTDLDDEDERDTSDDDLAEETPQNFYQTMDSQLRPIYHLGPAANAALLPKTRELNSQPVLPTGTAPHFSSAARLRALAVPRKTLTALVAEDTDSHTLQRETNAEYVESVVAAAQVPWGLAHRWALSEYAKACLIDAAEPRDVKLTDSDSAAAARSLLAMSTSTAADHANVTMAAAAPGASTTTAAAAAASASLSFSRPGTLGSETWQRWLSGCAAFVYHPTGPALRTLALTLTTPATTAAAAATAAAEAASGPGRLFARAVPGAVTLATSKACPLRRQIRQVVRMAASGALPSATAGIHATNAAAAAAHERESACPCPYCRRPGSGPSGWESRAAADAASYCPRGGGVSRVAAASDHALKEFVLARSRREIVVYEATVAATDAEPAQSRGVRAMAQAETDSDVEGGVSALVSDFASAARDLTLVFNEGGMSAGEFAEALRALEDDAAAEVTARSALSWHAAATRGSGSAEARARAMLRRALAASDAAAAATAAGEVSVPLLRVSAALAPRARLVAPVAVMHAEPHPLWAGEAAVLTVDGRILAWDVDHAAAAYSATARSTAAAAAADEENDALESDESENDGEDAVETAARAQRRMRRALLWSVSPPVASLRRATYDDDVPDALSALPCSDSTLARAQARRARRALRAATETGAFAPDASAGADVLSGAWRDRDVVDMWWVPDWARREAVRAAVWADAATAGSGAATAVLNAEEIADDRAKARQSFFTHSVPAAATVDNTTSCAVLAHMPVLRAAFPSWATVRWGAHPRTLLAATPTALFKVDLRAGGGIAAAEADSSGLHGGYGAGLYSYVAKHHIQI